MKERRDTEPQKCYFLRNDFKALEQRINWLRNQIMISHEEMGGSCRQSSETWHDNFGYEEANRSAFMWSTELRKLLRIRNNAIIIEPDPQNNRVSLGSIITMEDEENGEKMIFRIGSYLILEKNGGLIPNISYRAPLVAPFIGGNIDDSHEVELPRGRRSFILVDII